VTSVRTLLLRYLLTAACCQVTATTPFAIITALACDLPLYGLTGMRHGAAALAQHATISSVLLLVAGQVGAGASPGVCLAVSVLGVAQSTGSVAA
jgi:hypothetical protein